MADKVQEEFDYQDRAAKIMPTWSFWGEGIVLIKKEQWLESQKKIISLLRQLHKEKNRRKSQEDYPMKKDKLLAVLDMTEVEQYCWLCDHRPEYGYEITAYPDNPNRVLADLAFRLRDEVKGSEGHKNWERAKYRVCVHITKVRDVTYNQWFVDQAQPIHWIIASLKAKDARDG